MDVETVSRKVVHRECLHPKSGMGEEESTRALGTPREKEKGRETQTV